MMNNRKWIVWIVGALGVQLLLSPLLSIRGFRPDFVLITILYLAVGAGSFPAIIVGFSAGLLLDLLGVGSYFGLTSLLYVITGYLGGFLRGKYARLSPALFTSLWVGLLVLVFFLYSFFRYQLFWDEDLVRFVNYWLLTAGYTLGFAGILQFVVPLK